MDNADQNLPGTVGFEHHFFKAIEDIHFRMSEPPDERPVLAGSLGDQDITLPLNGIAREFSIEPETADGRMLDLVTDGLKFVCALRIGDQIPQEVLSGNASWEPEPAHLEFARKRLVLQAVTWNAGHQQCVTRREEIDLALEEAGAEAGEQAALAALAGRVHVDDLAALLDEMVEELARLELLRDRHEEIRAIKGKLGSFRKAHEAEIGMVEQIDMALRLIKVPIARFGELLAQADETTVDVEGLFANFEGARDALAALRNELFCWLSAWSDVFDVWAAADPRRPETFNLLGHVRDLTRFLAPRYMPVDQWELLLAKDQDGANLQYGGVMTW